MKGPKVQKQNATDLAIFGGEALFEEPLAVGRPSIPDIGGVVEDMREVLSSGVLTNNGPFVRRFEAEICKICETQYCVATCNATAALELTARALGLSGEVIVPSFTFVATAHAVAWSGLTPVFVDVDPTTHTIDPASAEAAITSATSAICGVHLWGNVCDVAGLQSIAERHELTLYFDAAHALSVSANGTPIGSFGAAEVLSFHATKFVSAFEGGAVVTNDESLAKTLREMRNFGFSDNSQVARLGTNAKMSEASAALGLRSLKDVDRVKTLNRRNYHYYMDALSECRGIRLSAPSDPDHSNCQYIVCEIDEREVGIPRDSLLSVLRAEGILAKRYFYPGCHRAAPYRDEYSIRQTPLPVTERLTQSVLVLPTGPNASVDAVDKVCAVIRYIVESAPEIMHEMAHRQLSVPDK